MKITLKSSTEMYRYICFIKFSLLLSASSLISCQRSTGLDQTTYRWSAQSRDNGQVIPNVVNQVFTSSASAVRLYGETIERSQQKIEGVVVEGSQLQKISSVDGKPQFLIAQYNDLINADSSLASELKLKARKMDVEKYKALEIIKRKYLPLKNATHVYPPEARVLIENEKPQFYWIIEYIDHSNSGVYSLKISDKYAIENIHRIESCFQERMSLVFPVGPKLSDLQEQLLRGLTEDGILSSPKVNLTSLDGVVVKEENGSYLFGPEDDRFDQVQSFFFIQKTLNFAETYWQLTLPFQLKVQLKAGYPKKMNTAFYYKGQIKVGDGDGESYQSIPRDPSIMSHEVMHAFIESISGLGTEQEAGSFNEGFADYLTATMWDNPTMGHTSYKKGPFKRTVSNTIKVSEKNGGLYHDSGIVSGTFWDIRYVLGSEKTQKLALKTIARLGAQPNFNDLKPAVLDAMKSMEWQLVDTLRVEEILQNRGW